MHAVCVRLCPNDLVGRRFEELQKQLPFICTASTKANCAKRYPSEILAGLLYLGDWANAEATDRFADLNIRRCRFVRQQVGLCSVHRLLAKLTRWPQQAQHPLTPRVQRRMLFRL